MAWEWKQPLGAVRGWSYPDFYAALSTLTEGRYTVLRAKHREEDHKVKALKAALPR